MIKTTTDIEITQKISLFQKDLKGIFTTADLYNIIGSPNPITNQRTIKRLVKAGILSPVKRGLYVTDSFDLWQLSRHIINNAYISLDSILAKNMLIGTLPQNRLSLVSTNKNLVIRFKNYRIDIYSLSDDLFFGFTQNNQGLNLADSEKAYLDMLYYHLRGYKFAIDPRNEINIQKLNKTKIRSYLIKYKNPKFVTFVKGLING